MGVNVKAVLGSVAVCGVLVLAGCSSGATASAPTTAEEITCICEGSEADCRLAVAEPSPVKGATGQVRGFNNDMGNGYKVLAVNIGLL